MQLDPWYLSHLVCPRDKLQLQFLRGTLTCSMSHTYPVADGVPVMLLGDIEQTIGVAWASLQRAQGRTRGDERLPDFYLESLGVSDEEKEGLIHLVLQGKHKIDPAVAYLVSATNGFMYRHLIGRMDSYPIPCLPLPEGSGRCLLDIGCNWGRWCIAAARKGYDVTGMDPSLGAIMAARRVARSLGFSIRYFVGDARYLPFPDAHFDHVFSYSVLQHLDRKAVAIVASEIGRVLKTGGVSLVQMPTRWGLRCLYHQARRRFREARDFEVRYWSLSSLRRLFTGAVGTTKFSVDCYFGIGLQKADWRLMRLRQKPLLAASEMLRGMSRAVPVLTYLADSIYVESVQS